MDILEIWKEAVDNPDKPEGWGLEFINYINEDHIQDIKDRKISFVILPAKIEDFVENEEERKIELKEMEETLQLEGYDVIDVRKLVFVYIKKKEVV
jgi:hypothetical protein